MPTTGYEIFVCIFVKLLQVIGTNYLDPYHGFNAQYRTSILLHVPMSTLPILKYWNHFGEINISVRPYTSKCR